MCLLAPRSTTVHDWPAETPEKRRAALREYRRHTLTRILWEQDLTAWRSRTAEDPRLQLPIPYASLCSTPLCQEVFLDTDLKLHEDYLEWSRLRCGATDFRGEWCQGPPGAGAGNCPACSGQHAGDPATYLWECPALANHRASWLRSIPTGASAPTDGEAFLLDLSRCPAVVRDWPRNLHYVGHAMRLRRRASRGGQHATASDASEDDPFSGPDEISDGD